MSPHHSMHTSALRSMKRALFTLVTILSFALSSLTANAVETDKTNDSSGEQSGGYVLEEILVTARKIEESLQITPISITAITAAALAERDLGDISGVADMSPNVNFSYGGTTSGSSSAAVVYIRGVGQNDFTPVTDPGVGIYIDGVYLARTVGAVLEALDLERIEILKGPQGTVFGRNTLGGAISLITRDPGDTLNGKLRFTVGEDNRYELGGSLDIPMSENLGMTFSALYKNRDGYVTRQDGIELGDDDVLVGRLKIVWEPTENLLFKFSADGSRTREESAPETSLVIPVDTLFPTFFNTNLFGNGSIDPACANGGGSLDNPNCANNQFAGAPYTSFETGPSRSDVDSYGFSLLAEWDVGNFLGMQDVTIRSITAHRGIDADLARASDGTPFLIFQTQDRIEQDQTTQEFQILGDAWDNRVHLVGGFFYFEEQGSDFGLIEAIPPNFPRLIGGVTDNDSWSVFSEVVVDITDRFRLLGGLRYTDENKRFDGTAVTLPSAPAQGGRDFLLGDAAGEATLAFDEVTWRASAMFDVSDNTMTYFTASRGFKSGGFDMRITQDATELPRFLPEFVTMYELGIKNEFSDLGLRLNAAVFYSDYTDIQVSANPPGQINTVTANAADGEVLGLEVEATWIPVPELQVVASLGLQDADYTDINEESNVSVSLEDDFIRTPEVSTSLGISYRFNLANSGSLTPHVNWNYRSKIAFEPVNSPGTLGSLINQDSYHVVNLNVAYQDPGEMWLLRLGINNLTDSTYLVAGDTNDTIGYVLGAYARERNWFLTVERSFK